MGSIINVGVGTKPDPIFCIKRQNMPKRSNTIKAPLPSEKNQKYALGDNKCYRLIAITAEFNLKQNGCLPLRVGRHPSCKPNDSVMTRCPESQADIQNVLFTGENCFCAVLDAAVRRLCTGGSRPSTKRR